MIRLLKESEVARLLPLSHQVQALHVAEFPEAFRSDASDAEVLGFFAEKLAAGAQIFVADAAGGALAGFLLAIPVTRPANPFQHASCIVELDQICVDADWRGQGVGRQLIAAMEDWMRSEGIGEWKSNVYGFNQPSRRLMAGAGAVETVIRCRRVMPD